MAQAEHKEWSVPFCSPPSAYSTAAEVTGDVGLNPTGTGSRSPGFNYQNTVCCLDKSHQQQQLSGRGVLRLLFRQCSQKETHSCISRHRGCHQRVCLQCACQVPYFLHLLRALCSTTAALDKALNNFLHKEGDPRCLRHFQSQADTVRWFGRLGGINSVWELGMQAGTWLTYFIMLLQHVEAHQFYFGKCVCFVGHFSIWITT